MSIHIVSQSQRLSAHAKTLALTTALVATTTLCGCASAPDDDSTLYQRLGGMPNVTVVIGRTIDRAAEDARTRRSFDGVKLAMLKDSIVQQVCALAGGGCRYEGETMANAHKDAKVVASEFEAMVSILREELDSAGTDPRAKNELLRLLAPMKRDIANPVAVAAQRR